LKYKIYFFAFFVLGHISHFISDERSPIRLFLLRIFARFIEVPLLHLSYLACQGRLKILTRFAPFRFLFVYPIAYPFGHWGDTGKPVPEKEVVRMIEEMEGPIGVGPCRCRIGHKACDHPLETDIVFRTGAEVWLEELPHQYRLIEKEEAIKIVRECARLGLFHMVFMHCLVGGAVNEYVICNCCTDGCVPYILNRTLGQKIYPLVKGEWVAFVDENLCQDCRKCIEVCPFEARYSSGGKTKINKNQCFGCGLCSNVCPGATLMVKRN